MKTNHFARSALDPALVEVIQELGFEKLTPIQAQSIPVLLDGRDLVGQSKTGSGKTAAFALPILQKISLQERDLQALILCPTRELCAQVAREIRKLGRRHPGLQVLVLSGGQPLRPQIEALRNGVHIVVGTPGRVLDHIKRRKLDLGRVQMLVLDEADRMLDMGFEEDMEIILAEVPGTRQTIFFSATYPDAVQAMSQKYQQDPVRVSIYETTQADSLVEQFVFEAEADLKTATLLRVLQHYKPDSAIVFCNQKASVAELARVLALEGVSSAALHGDLEQQERDRVMAKFRNGSTRVLIATDVAARGIDVENLHMVLNFDLPQKPDVYLHRIGRTARAGRSGIAVSLVSSREKIRLQDIEEYIGLKLVKKALGFAKQRDLRSGFAHREAEMETLFISGGRKDKLRPGDILGALTGEAGGLEASAIGKIEIHDHFSYVAISKQIAATALIRLRSGRIKGLKFQIKLVK